MSVGDYIRSSQVWKSIFRHPAPRDRRNRVVVMLTNFFLHLPTQAIIPGAAMGPSASAKRASGPAHSKAT